MFEISLGSLKFQALTGDHQMSACWLEESVEKTGHCERARRNKLADKPWNTASQLIEKSGVVVACFRRDLEFQECFQTLHSGSNGGSNANITNIILVSKIPSLK